MHKEAWTCSQTHQSTVPLYHFEIRKKTKPDQISLSDRSISYNTVYTLDKDSNKKNKNFSVCACWSELHLTGLEIILKVTTNGQKKCSFKEETQITSSKMTTQNC